MPNHDEPRVPADTAPTSRESAPDLDALDTRDWRDDAKHENGQYTNRCVHCDLPFVGHKYRTECRTCAFPGSEVLIAYARRLEARVAELEAYRGQAKRTHFCDADPCLLSPGLHMSAECYAAQPFYEDRVAAERERDDLRAKLADAEAKIAREMPEVKGTRCSS